MQSPAVGGILAQHQSTEVLKKVLRAGGEGQVRCRVPVNLAKDSVSSQDSREAVKAGKGTQAEGVGVGGWIGGGESGRAEPISK